MRIDLVSELRTPALAALDALATGTLAHRDDITASILVIESEASGSATTGWKPSASSCG